jgi:hypothetical protein
LTRHQRHKKRDDKDSPYYGPPREDKNVYAQGDHADKATFLIARAGSGLLAG